jgi:ureidoglycolate lyase
VKLIPEPLTVAGFAPFGEVVQHVGPERRQFLATPLEATRAMRFWTSRIEQATTLPARIVQLERHPHSAQTFVPMLGSRFLALVAPPTAGPVPDLAALRAFLAAPGQGISYRPGTWHHGMMVLDAPAVFAVMMAMTGREDDTEYWDLPVPLEIAP